MKPIFISLLILLSLSIFAQEKINLEDAIKQNKIQANCKGNDKSVHYLKPLVVDMKNLQNHIIQIWIESGTYFASSPAEYQDITVTESQLITLNPNESKIVEISGLCTEASLAAPGSAVNYSPKPAPAKEYIAYAKFIEQEKLFGTSEAQHGMWVFSNQHDWWAIYPNSDASGEISRKIRNQIAKIKGIELKLTEEGRLIAGEKTYQVIKDGEIFSKYTYTLTEGKKEPFCEMSGGAVFSLHKPTKMRISMFDKKNVLVREIYFNESEKAGMHKVNYAYDCEKYQEDEYHFKVIKNDHVVHIVTLSKVKRK